MNFLVDGPSPAPTTEHCRQIVNAWGAESPGAPITLDLLRHEAWSLAGLQAHSRQLGTVSEN